MKAIIDYSVPITRHRHIDAKLHGSRMKALLVCACVLLLALLAIYIRYNVGNSVARVQHHHGVVLPKFFYNLYCTGSTEYPECWIGGSSYASFSIRKADFQSFMVQFSEQKGFNPADVASGEFGGPSPTGRDHISVQWKESGEFVFFELSTEWD